MKNDDLDRILSQEEIQPSSGFTASVMEAVRREVAAPPPIPFPWRRALPGVVAAVVTLALILTVILLNHRNLAESASWTPAWFREFERSAELGASGSAWRAIGLALLVALFSVLAPIRFSLRRS